MAHQISASLIKSDQQSFTHTNNTRHEDKYSLVDQILSASNYYQVLDLTSEDFTLDELRRAYIRKSRICHPDKFVPPFPKATKSFQILSEAYKTLSEPKMKSSYDMGLGEYTSSYCSEDNTVDIFQQVIQQLYIELIEGEFQTLRTVIKVINETNGVFHISEEMMSFAETGFLKIRDFVLSSQKYCEIVQFELLQLHDLQDEIKNVSYLNIWRRLTLSMAIAKILIQIPLLVNRQVKKEQQYNNNCKSNTTKEEGLLGLQIEHCLEKTICLLN